MRDFYYLTKRNILIFWRDRAAVFFSILSMLIVLGLMVIFLGNMNSDSLVGILTQFGGARDSVQDEANAAYLVQMWTLAGILVVNAVTVTLTVMGNMVADEAAKKLAVFYVSPVKRIRVTLSYIASTFLVGFCLCCLTLFAGELYMLFSGYPLFSAAKLCKLFGLIALNVLVYAAISYLLALLVHSQSAWSGMLTIVGTLVGFVGAIYLPMDMLPEAVKNILKTLPVLHGAAGFREIATQDAIIKCFAGLPEEAAAAYKEAMGITVLWGEKPMTLTMQILILLIYGILAVGAAAFLGKHRRTGDR